MSDLSDKLKDLTPEQKQRLLLKLKEKGVAGIGEHPQATAPASVIEFAQGENFAYKLRFPINFFQTEFVKKDIVEPEAEMIQVEVKAASLNFRDLMIAMGMYPSTPGIPSVMGSDYAGVVCKVGHKVADFKVGDHVMILSVGSFNPDFTIDADSHFAKYQNVHQTQVFSMPKNLSFVQAAAIPTVFITSYYALIYVGQLKKEDRVLIHSATGGIGLAALEICKWKGCEIVATAGNDSKRALLKQEGIPLVMDSRTTAFAEQVLEYTKGAGVDVILNTLSGESMLAGLNILNFFGRFLHIDKKDIAANNTIPLGNFNKGLTFAGIDLGLLIKNKTLMKKLFQELNELFEEKIQPIRIKTYPYRQLGEALNYMSRSEHIGKLVIDFDI
jgi:NADPH:quinone reductase-like Zn-dependent oxidoreductase